MGKALRDLLGEFQFKEAEFNPRQVTSDMLSSKEVGPTTGNIRIKNDETKILGITIPKIDFTIDGVSLPYDRQYQKLAENALNIYGADSVRILTRGAVEPMQLVKRGVDRLSRIGVGSTFGNNTRVGNFIRNQLNSFTVPQFPSDEVNDLPDALPSTKNGLYGSLYTGGVNNSKNAIANALTSFLTPAQFTQNIATVESTGKVKVGGAAIDLAVNAGFDALQAVGSKFGLNSKRGGGNASISKINNPLNSGIGLPKFPSDYALENAFEKVNGIAIGQSQLMRTGGDFYKNYEGRNAEEKLKTLKVGDGDANANFSNPIRFSSYYRNTSINLLNKIKQNTESTQFTDYLQFKENPNNADEDPIYKFSDIVFNKKAPKPFSDQIYKNRKVNTDEIQYDLIADRQEIYNDAVKPKGTDAEIEAKIQKLSKDAQELNEVIVFGKAKKKIHTHAELSTKALLDLDPDLININIGDIFLMSNLTGLTDTPTVSWGEAKPVGSPYKFYFYESYEREISFKAQLYATNSLQLQLLWAKINKLQALNLPAGGGIGGIKGKIIRLEIGDIISENYGFLSNFTVTIPDNSPWEIHKNSQAPFMCEIDVTYKVIHSKADTYGSILSIDISKNTGIPFQKPTKEPSAGDLLKIGPLDNSLKNINPLALPLPELMNQQVPAGFPGSPDKPTAPSTRLSYPLLPADIDPLEGYKFTTPAVTTTELKTLYTEGKPLFRGGGETDYFTPRDLMDPIYRKKVFPNEN